MMPPIATETEQPVYVTASAPELVELAKQALLAIGTPEASAAFVARSLVDANLAGHDSHGVIRLPQYIRGAEARNVDPTSLPTLVGSQKATAIVDAHHGWGQPAMMLATEQVIELAREFGIAIAVVRDSFHIGRVAPYVEAIARAGQIGMAMASGSPLVAPFGGRSRVMGTNPIAWAVPRGEGQEPICLDVATSAIAEGKVRVARSKGLPVPEGVLLDRDGTPSIVPDDLYDGGALLPFGAHKGSGFSLLAQLLGRGLAGLDPSGLDGPRGLNGPVVIAIDIAPFTEPAAFFEQVIAQGQAVTESQPQSGVDQVMLPGDPERLTRTQREREGIPIPESTWAELAAMARSLEIPFLPER